MEPTEKQIRAFYNMRNALGWGTEPPETRKEISECIGRMQNEIRKRIALTGRIRIYEEYAWNDWGLGHDD